MKRILKKFNSADALFLAIVSIIALINLPPPTRPLIVFQPQKGGGIKKKC